MIISTDGIDCVLHLKGSLDVVSESYSLKDFHWFTVTEHWYSVCSVYFDCDHMHNCIGLKDFR